MTVGNRWQQRVAVDVGLVASRFTAGSPVLLGDGVYCVDARSEVTGCVFLLIWVSTPPIGSQQAGKQPRNCSLGMLAAPPGQLAGDEPASVPTLSSKRFHICNFCIQNTGDTSRVHRP
jgi:hypothetical protein